MKSYRRQALPVTLETADTQQLTRMVPTEVIIKSHIMMEPTEWTSSGAQRKDPRASSRKQRSDKKDKKYFCTFGQGTLLENKEKWTLIYGHCITTGSLFACISLRASPAALEGHAASPEVLCACFISAALHCGLLRLLPLFMLGFCNDNKGGGQFPTPVSTLTFNMFSLNSPCCISTRCRSGLMLPTSVPKYCVCPEATLP